MERRVAGGDRSGFEETVEYRSASNAAALGTVDSSHAPRIRVGETTRSRFASETEVLLRSRLRAVAWIFAVAQGMFFIRNMFLRSTDPVLFTLHAALLAFLVAVAIVLRPGRSACSIRHLRWLEIAVFGTTALYFAILHYRVLVYFAERNEDVQAMLMVKNTVLATFATMVAYAMFIPNTWRRASVMIFAIAIMPLLSVGLLRVLHPEVFEVMSRHTTFGNISDNILIELSGVLISIYGVYVINRLRVEAFDARQINQYRLGRKLGSGGMGEVYLAEHELLKRPCAVKLINLERMGDPRAIARFEREVRTTAGLSHPHTVDIYDYGRTDEGVFYYVMEYLRGMNLAQLVSKYGPLDPSRAVFLLRAACEALHEAHRAGLVHRDLKPANIFAATRGGRFDYVKLLDFGLVKTQQEDPDSPDMSEDGRVIGSPSFMSPEQALGEGEVDARSDVYSLGAVGYYLLTGEPPFIGRSVMRVMVAHARDPVRRPSELRPDLPSDLEAVVLRCLEKAPEDRYPDASSLAAALGSCEAGMGWSFERARLWWEANESPPPRAGLSDPIEATAF